MTSKPANPLQFQVCEKMCPECLFTPARIVDESRKAEIIESCQENGTYFVCHKGSLAGNNQLCCKGFYDQVPTLVTALAQQMGIVKFLPVPKSTNPAQSIAPESES